MKEERLASVTFANYITLLKLTKQRNPVQMMCYKDRTWCMHSRECGNTMCDRNFTEEEREQAIKWWCSTDFPLAMADFKTDGCGWRSKSASGENDGESTDA